MGRHKKFEEIDVEVDADMKDKVVDVEENQSKDLIYTFKFWKALSIGAVIVWIVYGHFMLVVVMNL